VLTTTLVTGETITAVPANGTSRSTHSQKTSRPLSATSHHSKPPSIASHHSGRLPPPSTKSVPHLRHSSPAGLELLPISGSIPRSSNTPSEETGVYFKTCCLRRYLSPGSNIRTNEAVCLRSDYLDRNISYGPSLHRTLRKIFTQELLLLDSIAERIRPFPGLGYTLKRSRLREVEKSLAKVRKPAFHCLSDSNIQIPSTPKWGNAGDSDRIWNPNDF
jgi:hypothetical protein